MWTYLHASLLQMCGRRRFLLISLLVVLVNAGLGILFILMNFNRAGLRPRYINLPSRAVNASLLESWWSVGPGANEEMPELFGVGDSRGNYTLHPFLWPGRNWTPIFEEFEACLVTQASVERLFWVALQVERWEGPVSVAVFVPGSDYAVAAAMVTYLQQCFPAVQERVSFHLVHPRTRPPRPSPNPKLYQLSCSDPEAANRELLSLQDGSEPREKWYPQNILRNLARRGCPAPYSLTVDVDMLPVPHMTQRLSQFLRQEYPEGPCWRCAFVVPVYEVDHSLSQPPQDKVDLLHLVLRRQARRYHIKVFNKNQGNSHLEQWEVESEQDAGQYRVLYNISSYEEFWEPVLVLPFTAPNFDERFLGYGFTRSSHVYELHLLGFHFRVLDGAFLTHRGFQTTASYSPSRYAQIEINRLRYQIFKRELHARLGLNSPPPLKVVAPIRQQLPALLARRPRPRLPPANLALHDLQHQQKDKDKKNLIP